MLLLDFTCQISMYRNVNASGMVLVDFFLYRNKLLLFNSDVDLILSHYLELASLYMSGQTTDFFSPFYT